MRRERSSGSESAVADDETVGVQFGDTPYPYTDGLKKRRYKRELRELQIELLKVQRWARESGQRLLLVLEGRDAAGKGGTIKRITEHLNPRGTRTVALLKPNDAELGQWYFQRYISHLPTAGEIVLFDRSWYNRAGVEPVFGYCTRAEYEQFLRQAPMLEESLVQDGLWLFKLWLSVGREEQRERLDERRASPLKSWKLTANDIASLGMWDRYTIARDLMFFHTHTAHAPWTIVRNDDKRRGRVELIRHVLSRLPYSDRNADVIGEPDPEVVGSPDILPVDGADALFDGSGEARGA